jgi:GxxExxY protein
MTEEAVIKIVLDEAFHVHKKIGPGMLESVYKTCLAYRLQKRGLLLETEKPVPVFFEEVKMDCGYRADILVEKQVIVETKSIEGIGPLQVAQVLTYLRFLGLRYGLILNFDVLLLKDGIRRVLNGYGDTSPLHDEHPGSFRIK